jgi:putative transcriptional regulator
MNPSTPPLRPAAQQDFLNGALLIAMPNMTDPRFVRAVVYLCEHDARHAFGIIVNKPMADVSIAELLSRLEIDADDPGAAGDVFYGGPVGMERGLVLHSDDYALEGTRSVGARLGLTSTREILVDIVSTRRRRPPPQRHLFAVGYAGWTAGQLESEIAANAWAHCEADEAIIFSRHPQLAWERALAGLRVTKAMLSPDWTTGRASNAPLH